MKGLDTNDKNLQFYVIVVVNIWAKLTKATRVSLVSKDIPNFSPGPTFGATSGWLYHKD